jgi:hypothetical protein
MINWKKWMEESCADLKVMGKQTMWTKIRREKSIFKTRASYPNGEVVFMVLWGFHRGKQGDKKHNA